MNELDESMTLHGMLGEHLAHDVLVTLARLRGGDLVELSDALEVIGGYLLENMQGRNKIAV